MTLSNQKCQICPTLRKTEREWLDYQIDTKKRWASYSHFLQQCIHYFWHTEPKLKKRITQLEEQLKAAKLELRRDI